MDIRDLDKYAKMMNEAEDVMSFISSDVVYATVKTGEIVDD